MIIHALPFTPARSHEVRSALEAQETALKAMLASAVEAHGSGGLRVVGSATHRHQSEIADAYLHCVELLVNRSGVREQLSHCLNSGQYDLQVLADTARSWVVDPEAA